jgi:hypothetical protein
MFENVHLNASDGVNFAKDYQNESYNKKFIEKNIDDKKISLTFKKHS